MNNGKLIQDHEKYRIVVMDDNALLFDWKKEVNLTIPDFKSGVAEFASRCKTQKPGRIIIDARQLDPGGNAVGWVSGQKKIEGEEEYNSWWLREIVPIYHEAGISSLAVATGNPNAPGAIDVSPGVNFKIGYFPDLESAMQWEIG